LEVVVVRGGVDGVAEEEGLDDTADAWFFESFEEVVEVYGAAFDEALYGFVDEVEGDGDAVITGKALLDDFACDGVDEPGLALCLLVDVGDGVGLEDLSCLGGVLGVEGGDFIGGEVPEGQGFGDDIERAEAAEGLVIRADETPVVTDVAQADKGDGVWEGEAGVAADVSVTELGDEGEEEGEWEAVNFVEEEDKGAVEEAAVLGVGVLEDSCVVVEIGVLQEYPGVGYLLVFERPAEGVEQGIDAFFGVG
jgi:hypothetical protein